MLSTEELMLSNRGAGEDSSESLGWQGDQNVKPSRKSTLNIHWKDWCEGLATWCKELTHWKRPWCWKRLSTGGEGDVRSWDGWMASLTQWTWVWAISGRQWRTGKCGLLQSMGSQRVRHDLAVKQQEQQNLSAGNSLNWLKYSLLGNMRNVICL